MMRTFLILIALGHVGPVLSFLLDGQCPDCHWNGQCNGHTGHCDCYAGFKSADCSQDCGCVGHGVCKDDNTCLCEKGWTWSPSQHRCVLDCTCPTGVNCIAPGVCGCAHVCKYGTCWNGQCECWEGYTGSTCSTYDPSVMMNRNISMGLNIAGLSYYSSELKFVDIAKQSQEWITERTEGPHSHAWDTHEHDVVHWRSDGYPASLPPNLVVLKLMLRGEIGQHAPRGNYTVLYDGEGNIKFRLVHHTIHTNRKGRIVVDFQPDQAGIALEIVQTNPADPIHNIRVIMPGFEDRYELFPFYPPFLENIMRFSEIRFMDFFHTNGHSPEPTTWLTRRHADFHTQTGAEGAAIEYAILLSNMVGANPWFPQPHAADNNCIWNFAQLSKNTLRPDLKVYVEYSNEVWNGIFRQTIYTREQGTKLGLDQNSRIAGMKYYNQRSAEIMDIWTAVFGSSADRLIKIWAWQTGYQDYTRQAIEDLGTRITKFTALGITGYFSCDKVVYNHNITILNADEILHLCKEDLKTSEDNFNYYLNMAKSHKLKLLMYEGGPGLESSRTHNDDVTNHAISFNRHGLMETAVTDVLEAWFKIVTSDPYNSSPGGLFNYFSSTSVPSKYGSWGMLEYTGQSPSSVPKYRAVQRYINRHFGNYVLGPSCSLVTASASLTLACFRQGHLQCGQSTDHGVTWKFFPTIIGNSSALVLDGYDPASHVLFVRSLDNMASNSYYTIDVSKPLHWTSHTDLQYHMELATRRVLRRQPIHVFNGVRTANMNCSYM